jgi:serine/threonine-protein kinase
MNFGIAKSLEARRLTFAGFTSTMGTPDYMSPEQVKSRRGDARTDIYSLGAMLYEMATGAVPFEGPNPFIVMNSRVTGDPIAPRKRNPDISPELEEIILHAMERDPKDRYPTAAAMKFELDNPGKVVLRGRHLHLKRPNLWKTRWRGARIYVYCGLLPVLVFGTMIFVSRCNQAKKKGAPSAPTTEEVLHGTRTGHR